MDIIKKEAPFKFSSPLRLVATIDDQVVYFRVYAIHPPIRYDIIEFGRLARLEATFKQKYGMMKIYEEDLQKENPYTLVDMFMVEPIVTVKPPWKEG